VIITARRPEAQLCWSEPWTGFSARTGHRGRRAAGELRLVHRAAVPARGELLRAAGPADRDPGTELNFALVPYHLAEQAPGPTEAQVRLIDAALAASPAGRRDWGICTECGMGRAGRDEIPALLDLHRQIVAAG
jgi:hypothetical protein